MCINARFHKRIVELLALERTFPLTLSFAMAALRPPYRAGRH